MTMLPSLVSVVRYLTAGLLTVAGTVAFQPWLPIPPAVRSGHPRILLRDFRGARIHRDDARKIGERTSVMRISSSAAADFGGALNATQESDSTVEELPRRSQQSLSRRNDLDMPWGEIQEWAMRDKLKQYTITAPVSVEGTGTETLRCYVLWRAMTDDVTELAGYPLSFLVERCLETQKSKEFNSIPNFSPEVLPYLDDFLFEPNGGLSGRIYGIRGVAEGTRIQTTPVTDVERTLPKGFVRTADGQIVYELGKPAAQMRTEAGKMAERVAASIPTKGISMPTNLVNSENGGQILDGDLVNLAGLTAVVVAGATAMQSLSHHLTVNMFWV